MMREAAQIAPKLVYFPLNLLLGSRWQAQEMPVELG
jgi:hypothetical protein